MKILIVHNEYKLLGGEESCVEDEISALVGLGHQVETYIVKNAEIKSLWHKIKAFMSAIYNVKQQKRIESKLTEIRPDIVHVHNFFPQISPAVFYACRNQKTPCVLTLHNYRILCPSTFLFYHGKVYLDGVNRHFLSVIRDRVYRNSYLGTIAVILMILVHQKLGTWSKASKIIVFSSFQKKLMEKQIDGNFTILKHFIASNQATPAPERHNYFLSVGRLSEEKGLLELIDIWPKNQELRIIGTGPLESEIQRAITLKNNITLVGHQTRKQVIDQLQKATALVFSPIWHETFGLVTIESFSTGTPVIYNDIAPLDEIIKDGVHGYRFDVQDAASLENAISNVKHHRNEIARNCLDEFNEKYSPLVGAQRLEQMLKETINFHDHAQP